MLLSRTSVVLILNREGHATGEIQNHFKNECNIYNTMIMIHGQYYYMYKNLRKEEKIHVMHKIRCSMVESSLSWPLVVGNE